MSRAPSTFRKQDVTRAVMATVAAGVKVKRVKISRDGSIEIEAVNGIEQIGAVDTSEAIIL